MPRILEFKVIEETLWARIGRVEDLDKDSDRFYLWTPKEAEDIKARAIRDFCFALANAYIEGRLDDRA